MARIRKAVALAAMASMFVGACGSDDAGTASANSGGSAAADRPDSFSIMAPADPGGGWDSTARALQRTLDEAGLVSGNVEVYNRPGAGGTIGLAEFATDRSGQPDELMVMGLVMVGAIQTNDAPVALDRVTPLASLTAEFEAIVVPSSSPFQTVDDLVAAFHYDPRSISWGGGSAGGSDHMLVALIADALDIDPADVNYIAHSGGGEALASILSGAVSVGVSSVSEFQDGVANGDLRYLAVSSAEPIEGVDAPTLASAGIDVELANWRGLVAPGGISDGERDALVSMVEELVDSPAWQEVLDSNGWDPFVHVGDDFETFLEEETIRVESVLRQVGLAA